MALSEFEIIERFFTWPPAPGWEIVLGVGDDAAEITTAPRERLILDVSQIREGSDFDPEDDAASVGHRLLAAAAARLAARGAEPLVFTLALSLPAADHEWLGAFSRGLAELARRNDIALIGGDTTRGPRAAVMHLHGTVTGDTPPVPDRGAAPGDLIYVGGHFGDAALAVLHLTGELQLPLAERQAAYQALRFPSPSVPCAGVIAGLASSATEVSASLATDLEALLARSGCGASVQVERLPLGPALRNNLERAGGWSIAVHGPALGQLCFTVPAGAQEQFDHRNSRLEPPCTWIGVVERLRGLRCLMDDGSEV